MKHLSFILIGLILSFSSLVSQQKPCTITISNPSPNIISNTINSAPHGSVICVNPGYYSESSIVVHSGITLRFSGSVIVDITSDFLIYEDCAFEALGLGKSSSIYIKFGNSSVMAVWGKASCYYTFFSPIGGNRWTGIAVLSTAQNSIFDHCDISGASYTGAGASAGLAIHGARVTVSYCNISNFTAYLSYTTSGIYASHEAMAHIFKNYIQNHSDHGVVADMGAYVFFGPANVSCDSGNNVITGNGLYGILAANNSFMNLSPQDNCNYNRISGNGGDDAMAWSTSMISAQGNYWGGYNPPRVSGNVLWSPASCLPNPPRLSVAVIEDNSSVGIGMLNKVTNTASIDELLEKAVGFLSSENYVEALDVFKSIIETPELNSVHGNALAGISAICRTVAKDKELGLDYKEIFEYLKVCSKSEEALPIAKLVYASTLSGLGSYDEAISEYEAIAKNYSGTDHEIQALVGISYTYLFYKKDLSKALEILKKVDEVVKEENDISVEFLRGRVNAELMNSKLDDADRLLATTVNAFGAKEYRFVDGFILYQMIVETLPEDYNEILEYRKTHINDKNATVVRLIYAGGLAKIGYHDEAISECEEVLKTAITDYEKIPILYCTWYIYYNYIGNKEKAAEILGKIADLENGNNGVVSVDNPTDLPTDYSLSQNYPNPFNPTTTIQYSIPKDEFVKLTVYDITGKVVKELVSGHKAAGRYSVEFNASSYSSGIYYYRLEAGQFVDTKKMLLIK